MHAESHQRLKEQAEAFEAKLKRVEELHQEAVKATALKVMMVDGHFARLAEQCLAEESTAASVVCAKAWSAWSVPWLTPPAREALPQQGGSLPKQGGSLPHQGVHLPAVHPWNLVQ